MNKLRGGEHRTKSQNHQRKASDSRTSALFGVRPLRCFARSAPPENARDGDIYPDDGTNTASGSENVDIHAEVKFY